MLSLDSLVKATSTVTETVSGIWDTTSGYIDKIVDFIYGENSAITKVDLEGNASGDLVVEIDALTELAYSGNSISSERQVESMDVYTDTIKNKPPSLNLTLVIDRSKVDDLKRIYDEGSPVNVTVNKWKDKRILDNGILQSFYISSFNIKEDYRQKNNVTIEITIKKIRTFSFFTVSGIYSVQNTKTVGTGIAAAGENTTINKDAKTLDPARSTPKKILDYGSDMFGILKKNVVKFF